MAATALTQHAKSPEVGNGPEGDLVANLQLKLPIRLIATGRVELRTCRRDEDISAVVKRNEEDQFDHWPVVTDSGHIVGLLELTPFTRSRDPAVGKVGERTVPLTEANLIGADASILSFVRDADRQRCRLVVSQHRISGLVSLSDLQRLPVRTALFAMVTCLEMTMADAIRSEFNGSTKWVERLNGSRRARILEEKKKSKDADTYVDALLFSQFADKVTIIKKSPSFNWPRPKFEDTMHKVEKLRNALAHANDYAATRQQAVETCQTVRAMDDWLAQLAGWKPTQVTSMDSGA